ncbi:MAG: hypothetical protein OHK0039_37060 [Bacteroidia bacterium]
MCLRLLPLLLLFACQSPAYRPTAARLEGPAPDTTALYARLDSLAQLAGRSTWLRIERTRDGGVQGGGSTWYFDSLGSLRQVLHRVQAQADEQREQQYWVGGRLVAWQHDRCWPGEPGHPCESTRLHQAACPACGLTLLRQTGQADQPLRYRDSDYLDRQATREREALAQTLARLRKCVVELTAAGMAEHGPDVRYNEFTIEPEQPDPSGGKESYFIDPALYDRVFDGQLEARLRAGR